MILKGEKMSRKEQALELKHLGYNCAQAVALAFKDLVDLDEESLLNLSTGFGAGGGDMSGTCGALSAVYLLNGLILGKIYKDDPSKRGKIMSANKTIAGLFREKNKAVICNKLKGIDTGEILRSCDGCVEDAAELLENYLKENNLLAF